MAIRRRVAWSAATVFATVLLLTSVRGDPALGAGFVVLLLLGAATVALGVVLLLVALGAISRGRARRREASRLPELAASLGLTFSARDDSALALCPEDLSAGAVAPTAEHVLTGWTAAGTLRAFEYTCLRMEQAETVPYRYVVLTLASPREQVPSVRLQPPMSAASPAEDGPGRWTITGLAFPDTKASALADALHVDLLRLGDPRRGGPATVRIDGRGAVAWWRGDLNAQALPAQITALGGLAHAVAAMAARRPAMDA